MDDSKLLECFENCSLPLNEFNHRNHLKLTWNYITQYPKEVAFDHIQKGIIRYAEHHHVFHVYNEQLTRKWFEVVFNAMQNEPATCFEDFIEKNNFLLNPKYIDLS